MGLNITKLAVAKQTNDIRMTLQDPACIVPRMYALVDAEWMLVTSNLFTPTVGVVPGYEGTPAGPHGANAPVIFGIPLDFVNVGIVPFGIVASQSVGAPGPITGPMGVGVPVSNSVVYLTAGGAMTLAAPQKDQQNTLLIASTAAAAGTVAFPTIGAGGAVTTKTASFPAGSNAALTLKAQGGGWVPVATAANGATIA